MSTEIIMNRVMVLASGILGLLLLIAGAGVASFPNEVFATNDWYGGIALILAVGQAVSFISMGWFWHRAMFSPT